MSATITAVVFDLRNEDFRTEAELNEVMHTRLNACRLELGDFAPVRIVVHRRQANWLKLEQYERDHTPVEELKKQTLQFWNDIPVSVLDDWEAMPCPNCGKIHDDE